jgi:uncharacterized PurR-regulated membrane protein YhhQ (DUF165 family)
MTTSLLVVMYLAAVVLANATFAVWGMAVEPWNSMLLIGLDLTSRDYLHRAWGGRGLALKMGALILAGSALSAALGWLLGGELATAVEGGLGRVALASAAGFGAAATIDTLAYGLLRRRWLRVNGSNALAALVDSAVFPFVAFGAIDWGLAAYFAVVKFVGGFLWWLVLGGWRDVTHWITRSSELSSQTGAGGCPSWPGQGNRAWGPLATKPATRVATERFPDDS